MIYSLTKFSAFAAFLSEASAGGDNGAFLSQAEMTPSLYGSNRSFYTSSPPLTKSGCSQGCSSKSGACTTNSTNEGATSSSWNAGTNSTNGSGNGISQVPSEVYAAALPGYKPSPSIARETQQSLLNRIHRSGLGSKYKVGCDAPKALISGLAKGPYVDVRPKFNDFDNTTPEEKEISQDMRKKVELSQKKRDLILLKVQLPSHKIQLKDLWLSELSKDTIKQDITSLRVKIRRVYVEGYGKPLREAVALVQDFESDFIIQRFKTVYKQERTQKVQSELEFLAKAFFTNGSRHTAKTCEFLPVEDLVSILLDKRTSWNELMKISESELTSDQAAKICNRISIARILVKKANKSQAKLDVSHDQLKFLNTFVNYPEAEFQKYHEIALRV